MFSYLLYFLFSISLLTTYSAFNGFSRLSFVSLLVVLVVLIVYFSKKKLFKINKKKLFIVALFLSWLILPIFSGLFYKSSFDNFKYIILVIFYNISSFLFVFYLIKNNKIETFIRFFSYFFVLVNVVALLFFIFFTEMVLDLYVRLQFSGIYNNRNVLAIASVFLLALWVFMKDLSNNLLLSLLIQTLLIVLIIATMSTKGLIGIVFIFLLYFVFNFNKKKHVVFFPILILVVTVVYQGGALDETLERFKGHLAVAVDSGVERSGSSLEREWLITKGLMLVENSPIIGVGLNNTQYYLNSPYRVNHGECGFNCGGTYTHNNYVEIFASSGPVSFVLFYIPYFLIWLYSFVNVIKLFYSKLMGVKYSTEANIMVSFSIVSLILIFDLGYVSYESLFKNFMFILISAFYFLKKV